MRDESRGVFRRLTEQGLTFVNTVLGDGDGIDNFGINRRAVIEKLTNMTPAAF